MDADEDEDVDRAVESDGTENGDNKDGERVDITLTGTGVNLGESVGEEEPEADRRAHV